MNRAVFALLLLVLLVGFAPILSADPVKLTGTVSITEDDDWNITAVKLTADDGTVYQIVLDENGKKLGNEDNGLKVQPTGTVAVKDDVRWLTVSDFKELTE